MPAMASGFSKTWATTLPVAGSSARISTSPTSGSGKIDEMKSRRVAVVMTAVVASDIALLRAEQFFFDQGRNGVLSHAQAPVADAIEHDPRLPDCGQPHRPRASNHLAIGRTVGNKHPDLSEFRATADSAPVQCRADLLDCYRPP